MRKKIKFSVIITLCVALMGAMLFWGVNSIRAEATDREITASGTTGKVNWTLYDDGELYVYGEGAMADYSSYTAQPWASYRNKISSITVDEGVTAIGESAFSVTAVREVRIASSVVSIGHSAFNGCTYLENAVLSYGVENIGASAFNSCTRLKSITLPDSITEIGMYCFEDCESLEKVYVPKNLYRLRDRMFMGCSALKDVTFSSNTKYLSASAFSGCTNLENVYYSGSITSWCSIFFGSETGNPLAYADNLYLNGQLVPSALVLPDTVTAIRQNAFYGASFLESVELPSGVTTIGSKAFSGCSNLKSITLSEKLKTIDRYAFENCTGLEEINIPASVTEIYPQVFNGCSSLCAINVDDGNKKFSSDSVGVLFDKEKTKLIQYPIGIESAEYVIPDTVESINSYAFYGCKNIGKLTLPESVKCIGEYAFCGCAALTDISVTDSVECIHKYAFSSTGYLNDKANWDNGFLYLGTLLIGADKVAADCRLYSKTTLVAAGVFENFKITSVYLPKNLKYINEYAFNNCDGLTSVDIPASVTVIGKEAFSACGSLEEIVLNEGLIEIQARAFAYLPKLTGIQIPGTVTKIDPTAFYSSGVMDIRYGNSKAEWKRAVNGESLGEMTIHYTLRSDDETVVINHTDESFDYEAGNVHLVVAQLDSVTSKYDQNGFYTKLMVDPIQILDIKLVDGDGNSIQPLSDQSITVSIKAPDEFMMLLKKGLDGVGEYDIEASGIDFVDDCFAFELDGETVCVPADEKFLKSFTVVHWYSDAQTRFDYEPFNHDKITVENGYIILETNHFSEYAVCTELVEFELGEIELVNGKSTSVSVTVSDGTEVTYSSSDESVVTVNENGVIAAVGPGTATITVTINGTNISDTCEVTVPARDYTIKWIIDDVETEQTVTEQTVITQPEAPEKEGYTFIGWTPEVPDTMPAENLEFTAVWQVNKYTVTFDTAGGTVIAPITLDYGAAITSPVNPQKDGYTFVGWNPELPETMPATDLTVVAVYEEAETPEVPEVTVTGIKIIALPNKTQYTYKVDSLDLSGLVIKMMYSDGSSKIINDTKAVNAYGFSNDTVGTKTVTVSYGGYTDEFEITVSYAWWQWIIRILLLGFIWY